MVSKSDSTDDQALFYWSRIMLTSGIRVLFTSGEYDGKRGIIIGSIPRRYRSEDIVYRVQIDGFPIVGGWSGKVTSIDEHFEVLDNRPNVKQARKPRPYGTSK
jgi:hypothetical protein